MSLGALNLLAAVLNTQVETAEPSELDDAERRWEAYARGAPWTPEDARLAWTSPAAREAYLRVREQVLSASRTAWKAHGFGEPAVLRAADSGDGAATIKVAAFAVQMIPAPDGEWLVSLEVTDAALAMVPAGARFELVDSGGHSWLAGAPDGAGVIDAFWTREDQSPVQRARDFALTLNIV